MSRDNRVTSIERDVAEIKKIASEMMNQSKTKMDLDKAEKFLFAELDKIDKKYGYPID